MIDTYHLHCLRRSLGAGTNEICVYIVLPPLGNNAHRSGHVRKASDAARSTASVSSTTSASSPNRRPGDTVSALNDTEMSSADLESKLSQIFALQDRTFNMTVSLDKLSSFAAGEIIAKLDRVQERLDQIERNQQEQLREIQNLQSLTLSKKGRKQLRRQLENDQRRTNIGQMDAKDPKHNSRSPRLEESTDIEDPTGRRDRQLMMQQVKGCSLHDDEAAVKGLQKLSNLYKRSEHGKSGGIHWFRKSK